MVPVSRSTKRRAVGTLSGRSHDPLDLRLEVLTELVEHLTGDVVLRHVAGRRVLLLGERAKRIEAWTAELAASIETLPDEVVLAGGPLPHDDASFDVVLCLRTVGRMEVPAEPGQDPARRLFAEVARVLDARGQFLVDFENPRSLRGSYYKVRNPKTVIEPGPWLAETAVGLTRFDTLGRFLRLVPPTLSLTDFYGVQVLIPAPHALALPLVGRLLAALEWRARDNGLLRHFGAHVLCILRKLSGPVPGQ